MTDPSPNSPDFIFKIIPSSLWDIAKQQGIVPPMPIDEADGYMHFSTAKQLRETLSLHFKGQSDLVVLKVALAAIAVDLKWEPSRGGALFPHLYAPLRLSAIVSDVRAAVDAQGVVDLTDTI